MIRIADASTPAPAVDELTGRAIGDFIIREKLGVGGFGAVYRAWQPLLGRDAVVKVLNPQNRNNSRFVQRFLREAQLASKLDHPYAAHVYAFGVETDGLMWIAMELVRGAPLDNLIALRGPLTVKQWVPLLEKICEVTHTAHEQGIIHRDIKPANLMVLSRAGRLLPKLLDFGIAKMLDAQAQVDVNQRKSDAEQFFARVVEGPAEEGMSSDDPTLSRGGVIVGSPPYMAPEQWIDPAAADARTDIYALAILTYFALTGRRPFNGETSLAIAKQHARLPFPPLGEGFRPDLDAILRVAAAKKPHERFGTALELAGGFRTAAHLLDEPARLPQLDDVTMEALLTEAPQPIAEAAASYESATTPGQGIDFATQILRATIRYLAVLSLSSRARLGRGAETDSSEMVEALQKLRKSGLSDHDWLTLGIETCRPFCDKQLALPIPELVPAFFGDASQISTSVTILRALIGRVEEEPAKLDPEAQIHWLGTFLPELSRALSSISLLFEYPLVVAKEGRFESWVGVRRPRRIHLSVARGNEPEGEPLLLNREKEPVLALEPLAQVIEPTPGATPELFFVDSPGRNGVKLISFPHGFERHDSTFWNWYREHLLDCSEMLGLGSEERAPYLGLAAFSMNDSANFFGRENETEAFVNRLKIQSLLAVVGPSGAGKSSFVQAGVIPNLPPKWQSVTVRPGPTPLATLSARLHQEGIDLLPTLELDPAALGKALKAHATQSGIIFNLVIDQFEELLTLCLKAEERELYAQAIVEAARGTDNPVRVVITLRDDFLIRVQQLKAMKDQIAQGLQLLSTPAPEDLERILAEPARRAGYTFDDPQLVSQMVRAVADQPGALALLSFTASKIWELRDRRFHFLTRSAHDAVGGVGGALAHHAEAVLNAMEPPERALVRDVFRALVTADGTRAVVTRRELVQILRHDVHAESVIEKLVHARLIVAAEAQAGEDQLEIIHEALLQSWPRLVRWQREDAESSRMRDQLRAAARQWVEKGMPKGVLWRGEALTEYKLWKSRYPGGLTADEQGFASACLDDERRSTTVKRFALVGAFAILCIGLVVLFQANRRIRRSDDESHRKLALLHAEQGRNLFLGKNPMQAVVYLAKALEEGLETTTVRYLLARSFDRIARAQKAVYQPHHAPIYGFAVSADESLLATAGFDPVSKVINLNTGAVVTELVGHKGEIRQVRLSPDATRAVTGSADKTAKLWSIPDGRLIATMPHTGLVDYVQFSSDGRLLLTVGYDKMVSLWAAEDGKPVRSIKSNEAIGLARFSPDGTKIITCGGNAAIAGSAPPSIWDAQSGERLYTLAQNTPTVRNALFTPSGSRIVTVSADDVIRTWSVENGKELSELAGHYGAVRPIVFTKDESTLISSGEDKTVRIWDLTTRQQRLLVSGHNGAIRDLSLSVDDRLIATASEDGTIQILERATGKRLSTLFGHVDQASRVHFSNDGKRLVSTGADGTVRVWDAQAKDHRDLVSESNVYSLSSVRSTNSLIIPHETKVDTYDALSGRKTGSVQIDPFNNAIASEDGRIVIALSFNNMSQLRVYELASGKKLSTLETTAAMTRWALNDRADIFVGHENGTITQWKFPGFSATNIVAQQESVTALAISRDSKLLAIGSPNGHLNVFNLETNTITCGLAAHHGVITAARFSDADGVLASGGRDAKVYLWDPRTCRVLSTFEGQGSIVKALAFSPNGSLLVSTGQDGTSRVWDVASQTLLDILPASEPTFSVTFTPDGKWVATVGTSGKVKLWNVGIETRSHEVINKMVQCVSPFRLISEHVSLDVSHDIHSCNIIGENLVINVVQ